MSKQYPKNQAYNTDSKFIFQKASTTSDKRNTASISGTFIEQISKHSIESINGLKKSENTEKSHLTSKSNISPQIITLSNRIEFLEKELLSLSQMLLDEQQSQKQAIQGLKLENQTLRNSITQLQQVNGLQETKIKKLEVNNHQLLAALQSLNQQYNKLRTEGSSRNMNESKTSKSRQQVQQDIVRLNQEIGATLQKLNVLSFDYEQLMGKNEELIRENERLREKIRIMQIEGGENSIQLNKDDQILYFKEEILLLKEEIEKINQISIKKQSEMQENFHGRLQKYQQQIQKLKKFSLPESSNLNSRQSQAQTMLEVKDVQIRSLEVDGQVLKKQLQIKTEENQILQAELKQLKLMNSSVWSWKQKVHNLEQVNKRQLIQIEQNEGIIRKCELRIKETENECSDLNRQLKEKNFKIEELEFEYKSKSRYEAICKELQQELEKAKQQNEDKQQQLSSIGNTKKDLCQEIQILREQLLSASSEVSSANIRRQKMQVELEKLKREMQQLKVASGIQSQHIKQIESEQQNSRLRVQKNTQAQVKNLQEKIDCIQRVNKELQKLVLNQKVQKQNQNKKYKDVIEHYKQLNQQLSIQLELYRDSNIGSHPNCPLQNHKTWKTFEGHRQEGSAMNLMLQLERQKGKNQALMEQYQKNIEYQKGNEIKIHELVKKEKQFSFLKLDNSSLRSQISQLNSKIAQLKNILQIMKKSEQNLKNERQNFKYALQREYEAKLEVQKYQIINQYNILLKDRNVQFNYNHHSLRDNPIDHEHKTQHSRGNSLSIRSHPDYKKLQQQFMKLHRRNLQSEQLYNKQITECKDQIQKLLIQNQYHKKTIDDILADGYGLRPEDFSRASFGTRVNRGSSEGNSDEKSNINIGKYNEITLNQQKLKNLLKPVNEIFPNNYAHVEKSEINHLKVTIDSKLIELQITPREPSSTVERADWLIQKLSSMIDQLRQDCQTIRRQKKEQAKQTNRLKVRIETLQYQKTNILQQLSIAIQKYQFLQKKYEKLSTGNSRTKRQAHENEIPNLYLSDKITSGQQSNEHQNDVHLHEASLIRQHRLDLLRRYQKEIQNMEQEHVINFSK